jgi:hypothetical protein
MSRSNVNLQDLRTALQADESGWDENLNQMLYAREHGRKFPLEDWAVYDFKEACSDGDAAYTTSIDRALKFAHDTIRDWDITVTINVTARGAKQNATATVRSASGVGFEVSGPTAPLAILRVAVEAQIFMAQMDSAQKKTNAGPTPGAPDFR